MIEGVEKFGSKNWVEISKHVGHDVNGQQCYSRWKIINPENEKFKKTPWNENEVFFFFFFDLL